MLPFFSITIFNAFAFLFVAFANYCKWSVYRVKCNCHVLILFHMLIVCFWGILLYHWQEFGRGVKLRSLVISSSSYLRLKVYRVTKCLVYLSIHKFISVTMCIHLPKRLYWLHFSWNLLFHILICVSYHSFIHLGRVLSGPDKRYTRYDIARFSLSYKTRIIWAVFRYLMLTISLIYYFLQKKCCPEKVKMFENHVYLWAFLYFYSHIKS